MISLSKWVKIRYIIILLLVSALFVVGGVVWIDQTTSEKPRFSVESGFYEESFYLDIASEEGSVIYYTLDGSIPDENSMVYEQPILIKNATENENVYSMRTDTSTGFLTDLIAERNTLDSDPGYMAPDFLVDKCTIIRAVSIAENGLKSEEVSASYFVGIAPEEYEGCKIISLITDPDYLFDPEIGIYVTGNVFEIALNEGGMGNRWMFWPGNYRMKGKDWEREAIFHFFDEQGTLELIKEGGIRVHGGVSRGTLPKSLNLYSRTEYDGASTFNLELFDNQYNPKRITLSAGGDQLITQFSDYVMTERVSGLNFATLSHVPYILFINGEYWGFYWLNEKYDEKYLEYYYGVDEDNVILLKNGDVEAGEEGDEKLFEELELYIQQLDMSKEENYQKVCEMIDMDSYIDYNAVMLYIARRDDWPFTNFAVWRTRDVKNDEYSDGRWRWMLFDCNSLCMGNEENGPEHNTLDYMLKDIVEFSPMFASLWENEIFRQKFQERIFYVADECFAAGEMSQFIDEYNQKMIPILSKSWERFYGQERNVLGEFYNFMEYHRLFFNGRRAVVESWFNTQENAIQ